MNKFLLYFALLFFSSHTIAQSTSAPLTFDKAMQIAATEISAENILGTFAILNVALLSNELSLQICRLLENKLVKNKGFQLVSRNQIEQVMIEQNFGLSGYVDDASAQRVGYILGAEYILLGDLTKPENKYFLNIQVLETETARLIYSNTFEIKNSELRNYEKKTTPKKEVKRF